MKTTNFEGARVIPGPGSHQGSDRSMGALLIDAGKITTEDAERILRHAKEKDLRFGDAAVALRLVTLDDVQHVLARQFDYPYLQPGESAVARSVVAAWSPFGRQVEALRALRSQLLLRWFTGERDRKAIAVVSHARGDGRSHLAANLAVVFSQLGEKTLLVDADMRNPTQHTLFALSNSIGLSTVLAERAGMEAVQRVPAFVDLSVLPAGTIPPNPLELLSRGAFAKAMQWIGDTFDVVIMDTPSAVDGTDFQLVGAKAGGALLVGRRNRTGTSQCADMADAVRASGAVLVGNVLNER